MNREFAWFSFSFAFFSLAWLAGSHLFLPVEAGQKDYGLMIIDPDWIWVSILGFLAAMTGFFATGGLYQILKEKTKTLAFIGYIILSIGIMLELASLSWDLFIWPELIRQPGMTEYMRQGIFLKSMGFQYLISAMLASLLIGNLLISISMWKSKIFPAWLPASLLVGILLYTVGSLVSILAASFGLGIYSLGFAVIGYYQLKISAGK